MKGIALFDAQGFCWQRTTIPADLSTYSLQRVCFRFYKMLPEFVWDAAVLEGNPFTFPEVKTLLDGITVGGRKVYDQAQAFNENMVRFYLTKNADEMMQFLIECYPKNVLE